MSVQFEPNRVLGTNTERYDSLARVYVKYLTEGEQGFALAVEVKMDELDALWAAEGEL